MDCIAAMADIALQLQVMGKYTNLAWKLQIIFLQDTVFYN